MSCMQAALLQGFSRISQYYQFIINNVRYYVHNYVHLWDKPLKLCKQYL
jgi:hypothetical protein